MGEAVLEAAKLDAATAVGGAAASGCARAVPVSSGRGSRAAAVEVPYGEAPYGAAGGAALAIGKAAEIFGEAYRSLVGIAAAGGTLGLVSRSGFPAATPGGEVAAGATVGNDAELGGKYREFANERSTSEMAGTPVTVGGAIFGDAKFVADAPAAPDEGCEMFGAAAGAAVAKFGGGKVACDDDGVP